MNDKQTKAKHIQQQKQEQNITKPTKHDDFTAVSVQGTATGIKTKLRHLNSILLRLKHYYL